MHEGRSLPKRAHATRERIMSTPPETVPAATSSLDLTERVRAARSGLRRHVAELVAALEHGDLFIPLRCDLSEAPEGERVLLRREFTLTPHVVADERGQECLALFTRADLLHELGARLRWTTDGGELKHCAIDGRAAFEMVAGACQEHGASALVIDPTYESELVLEQNEVDSIASGRPIPLLGYVRAIPVDEAEPTTNQGGTAPEPLENGVKAALGRLEGVLGHRLEQNFNPDRDLEPHWTLVVATSRAVDHKAVAQAVLAEIADLLPPPGYIDVVFEEPRN